jgi:ABC-type lipopolysaccharide export system ATPase subunit
MTVTAMSLKAYDLWKQYDDAAAVQGISFTLQPGEIVGLLGPIGAGQTTTVGMLFGTVIPTRGFVKFGPWQLPAQGQRDRSQMGTVTQEDNLDPDFTVFNNLPHFAHHFRMTGKDARQRAGELLALVNLEDKAQAQVAGVVRKVDQVNMPIFLAIIPMFTLCGTYFPRSTLPPLLGAFAGILPLASLVDLLRWPLGLPEWWPLLLVWLLAWTVFLARLAAMRIYPRLFS